MGAQASAELPGTIDEDSRVVQETVKAIRSVRFGQVQNIQDSRVVQTAETEKVPLVEEHRVES